MEKRVGEDRCDFVQIADGVAVTANLDSPALRILKLERHPDAQIFTYDANYQHHEARLSDDGSTATPAQAVTTTWRSGMCSKPANS